MSPPRSAPAGSPADRAVSYPGWVVRLARIAVGVFFRRVEVVGASRVPADRPLLYVANHNNGLVDPVLVVAALPGRPRFLAKSTLWGNPFVRPFLALGRVIPVSRRQDPGFDPAANEEAFGRCREVLAAGGAVALFPEGTSHSEPGLAPMRTGAARMLAGIPGLDRLGLAVVPVGLLFDAKDRFRSRALVKVGEPFDPAPELAAADPREGVRRLTERIGAAIESVTVSYPSWDEARLIERAVDLYLREEETGPRPALGERLAAARAFLAARERLERESPERLAELRRAVRAYDRALAVLGVRDEQVLADPPPASATRFVFDGLVRLLVLLPLGAVGVLLNYPPYRVCGWLGALAAREPDRPASHKLFAGLVLFPLAWLAWAAAAWAVAGPAASLATLVAGPATGAVALRFRDRLFLLATESRAYLRLRLVGDRAGELRARRREVRRRLLEVAAELSAGEETPAASAARPHRAEAVS